MPDPFAMTLTGFNADAIDDAAFSVDGIAACVLGKRVARATATLPQTAAAAIFTVAGGLVLLKGIFGYVTTVIQTQANNTKLTFNPTVTGSSVDMCAVLSITADVVGTIYTITGTIADAMVDSLGALKHQGLNLILQAGTIDLDCAASNTGSVRWVVYYVPIDEGATIVAA